MLHIFDTVFSSLVYWLLPSLSLPLLRVAISACRTRFHYLRKPVILLLSQALPMPLTISSWGLRIVCTTGKNKIPPPPGLSLCLTGLQRAKGWRPTPDSVTFILHCLCRNGASQMDKGCAYKKQLAKWRFCLLKYLIPGFLSPHQYHVKFSGWF